MIIFAALVIGIVLICKDQSGHGIALIVSSVIAIPLSLMICFTLYFGVVAGNAAVAIKQAREKAPKTLVIPTRR
jgi:hypothetical protein